MSRTDGAQCTTGIGAEAGLCGVDDARRLEDALLMEVYYEKIRLLKACMAKRAESTEGVCDRTSVVAAPPIPPSHSSGTLAYTSSSTGSRRERAATAMCVAQPPPSLPLQQSREERLWMHASPHPQAPTALPSAPDRSSPQHAPSPTPDSAAESAQASVDGTHGQARPSSAKETDALSDAETIRAQCRRQKWPAQTSRRLTALSLPSRSAPSFSRPSPPTQTCESTECLDQDPARAPTAVSTPSTTGCRALLSPAHEEQHYKAKPTPKRSAMAAPAPHQPPPPAQLHTSAYSAAPSRTTQSKSSEMTSAMAERLARTYRMNAAATQKAPSTRRPSQGSDPGSRGATRRPLPVARASRSDAARYTVITVSAPPVRSGLPRSSVDDLHTDLPPSSSSTLAAAPAAMTAARYPLDASHGGHHVCDTSENVSAEEEEETEVVVVSPPSSPSPPSHSPLSPSPHHNGAITAAPTSAHGERDGAYDPRRTERLPLSQRALNAMYAHAKPSPTDVNIREGIAHSRSVS